MEEAMAATAFVENPRLSVSKRRSLSYRYEKRLLEDREDVVMDTVEAFPDSAHKEPLEDFLTMTRDGGGVESAEMIIPDLQAGLWIRI